MTAEVARAMLRMPKVLGVSTSLAEARSVMRNDHVHLLLLTEAGRLLGTLTRGDLEVVAGRPGGDLALGHAPLQGRTVHRDEPLEAVRRRMLTDGIRRLAVIDDEQRLLGLLCLKKKLTGFCSDDDIRARIAERQMAERQLAGPRTTRTFEESHV